MGNVFLNNKGHYLVVTTKPTRAVDVSEYKWVAELDQASVFNHISLPSGFTSKHFFPSWYANKTPTKEIIARASVEVVRTVTIKELTAAVGA